MTEEDRPPHASGHLAAWLRANGVAGEGEGGRVLASNPAPEDRTRAPVTWRRWQLQHHKAEGAGLVGRGAGKGVKVQPGGKTQNVTSQSGRQKAAVPLPPSQGLRCPCLRPLWVPHCHPGLQRHFSKHLETCH